MADIEGESVFLVRAGDDVRALSPDARHMSGEVVWWCEASKIFWEDHHGSVFDAQGRKIGGPARGGLNRFETTLTGGEVVVNVEQVTQGELQPRGEWPRDAAGVRDGAPPTFCADPLRP